jgi:response regulator RpfG family c-di-GMP phosphodiesterase
MADTPMDAETSRTMAQTLLSVAGFDRPPVADHCRRVARWAQELGQLCGLSDTEMTELHCAALLHDIALRAGEINFLIKPTINRTLEERLRQHPRAGAAMLLPLAGWEPIAKGVLHHHEKFNGDGYPDGLKGEAIPLYARIIAVADMFDLDTRAGGPHNVAPDGARRHIADERGRALDPELANRFLFILSTSDEIAHQDQCIQEISFSALQPGMILARDLCAIDGTILLRKGVELSQSVLDRAFASSNLEWLLTTAHVDARTVN